MLKNLKKNFIKVLLSLFYFSLGIAIFFSLNSHDFSDNSFFRYDSSNIKIQNLLGIVGSITSDLLFEIFGEGSYFFSLFFIFHSIKTLFNFTITWYSWAFIPISLILLCFIAEFQSSAFYWFDLSGGILGLGLFNYYDFFLGDHINLYVSFSILILFLFLSFLITLDIKTRDLSYFFSITYRLSRNLVALISYGLRFSKKLKLMRLKDFQTIKKPKYNDRKYFSKSKLKETEKTKYVFPSIDFLEKPNKNLNFDQENKKNSEFNKVMLANVLSDFKINGEIVEVKQGPIVTLFELAPAPGTQSSSVIRLSDDIARSMRSSSARISTIQGKDALGIEIPNKNRETVYLREILDEISYKSTRFKLPLALGKDIFGKPVVVDLAKMPHLLVAGTTGSGKSVGINAMLLSLLYTLTPEECRLILIDPKMLELSVYKGIPHLLTEVVTDPRKAISALKWTVKEMEERYKLMAHLGVREIEDYNKKVKRIIDDGEVIFQETQVGFDSETGKPILEKKALDLVVFPKIVLVVDELADLMITSGKEIESAIQRLSQMARAAGIHLIVATQRPSVDVITGTIKSNFPTRISYKVVNKINSRTILEEQGAEQLLGQGDLLITMLGERLLRVHGPFVKTEEVQSVVAHLKNQGEPEYIESVTVEEDSTDDFQLGFSDGGDDLYNKAVSIVCREKRASTSFIQRHLQIGYNRAARIIERMESEGIVSPANHVGRREVLVGKGS